MQTRLSGESRLHEMPLLPIPADGPPKPVQQCGRVVWLDRERLVSGKSRRSVRVQRCEQPGRRNLQGLRQTQQCQDSNIAQTTLDLADIRPKETCAVGQCPLRETALLSILAESHTQELQGWVQALRPFSHGVPIEESM